MTAVTTHSTARTVRPRLTVVNSVVPTVSENRTPDGTDTPGRRLERYITARWGRGKGGIRGLCSATNIAPESMYAWFRGETEPQLGSLTKIAEALGVSRVEVLAAMDGQLAEPSEEQARRIAREEALTVLQEAIDAGRIRVLPETPPERRRAAGPR